MTGLISGAGLGCGKPGGDACQLAFQFSGPFSCGAGAFFGLASGGVGEPWLAVLRGWRLAAAG